MQAIPYDERDGALQGLEPDAKIDLNTIFNAHWDTADSYLSGGRKTYLSVHFDYDGEAYVLVRPPGWRTPLLYQLGAGMRGAWRVGEDVYRLSLNVSIFRRRTNNYVVITKDGEEEPIYKKRIWKLLAAAYHAGRTTPIKRVPYQLYFSYAVRGDKNPYRMHPKKFGIVLTYNAGDDKDHDYYNYIVDYDEVSGGRTGYYKLFNGQKVAFRVPPNTTVLEFYDLTGRQVSLDPPQRDDPFDHSN